MLFPFLEIMSLNSNQRIKVNGTIKKSKERQPMTLKHKNLLIV